MAPRWLRIHSVPRPDYQRPHLDCPVCLADWGASLADPERWLRHSTRTWAFRSPMCHSSRAQPGPVTLSGTVAMFTMAYSDILVAGNATGNSGGFVLIAASRATHHINPRGREDLPPVSASLAGTDLWMFVPGSPRSSGGPPPSSSAHAHQTDDHRPKSRTIVARITCMHHLLRSTTLHHLLTIRRPLQHTIRTGQSHLVTSADP